MERIFFVCLLWLWTVVPRLYAQSSPQAVVPPYRWLFVVEASRSMASEALAARQTVADLLRTGLQGQMRTGDLFGLWTFNDEVYTNRFPMIRWQPELNLVLANQADKFLKIQRFENKTRLDKLCANLEGVWRKTAKLTIVMISDGDDTVRGTVFDSALNRIYEHDYRELHQSKTPFVTTLLAEGGQLVGYTVNAAGLSIVFEELARRANSQPAPSLAPDKPEPARPLPTPLLSATPSSNSVPATSPAPRTPVTNATALIVPGLSTNEDVAAPSIASTPDLPPPEVTTNTPSNRLASSDLKEPVHDSPPELRAPAMEKVPVPQASPTNRLSPVIKIAKPAEPPMPSNHLDHAALAEKAIVPVRTVAQATSESIAQPRATSPLIGFAGLHATNNPVQTRTNQPKANLPPPTDSTAPSQPANTATALSSSFASKSIAMTTDVVIQPQGFLTRHRSLAIGTVLFLAALALVFWSVRPRQPSRRGSSISRALDRHSPPR
ncbi:MAG: hypothetical protein M1608_14865 [Candidatus Omnitrophica bacterium]|nr:hypothetical protein [Candidatus Omnitrophota bacterium]